jgi:hypothetical protein
MQITLVNAGEERTVEIPLGSRAGAIRQLHDDLEEIGAPSTYTFSINGEGVTDDEVLTPNCRVALRPEEAKKG